MTARRTVVVLLLAVLAGACGGPAPSPTPSPSPRPHSGAVRIGLDIADYESFQRNEDGTFDSSFDPSATWAAAPFAIFRCCLLRTLMSYNGRAVADGGAELQPDLADGYPDISLDGLTWTFQIRQGVKYAPPFGDVEVTSHDFVRALERAIRQHPLDVRDQRHPFAPYAEPYLLPVIAGAGAFTDGAASISGLETPTDYELVIHLTQPTGDLGARLALPAGAPIPPGAADGHDTLYGRHLAATGPYMIEGSDQLQPSLPPDQQPAVAGYVPGERLTLVPNPNWDPALDPLRDQIAPRIEIVQVGYDDQLQATLNDEIDTGLNVDLLPEDIDRLRGDPATAPRLHIESGGASDWVMFNLAVPPFDDLAVRRAVQFAVNRQTLLSIIRPNGIVQTHSVPDVFANDLLTDYDPYGARDHAGDPVRAHEEMAKSRYDADGDGVCDDPVCLDIPLPFLEERPELAVAAQAFMSQLASLGLTFNEAPTGFDDYWPMLFDPGSKTPMAFTVGWSADYLNGASWWVPLARSSAVGQESAMNLSLIGASPDDLAAWGYDVTDVPNIDAQIDNCVALTGAAQFQCWAELDQFATERLAAWVPIDTRGLASITSSLVVSYETDAALGMPSLGRLRTTRP